MLNPKLKPYSILIGEWDTNGMHRLLPGLTLHGHVSVDWIEDGGFLRVRTQVEQKEIPDGIYIFGSDDATDLVTLSYFDVRGVSRVFQSTFSGNVWKFQRIAPGFSQRNTATFAADNNTIHAVSELSSDDATWQKDLEQTYTRVR
jgi:hypothetical protein